MTDTPDSVADPYGTRAQAIRSTPIVTDFIYPPIPDRNHDWCAHRDDYEPGDLIGYGRTEREAIADLLMLEDDQP